MADLRGRPKSADTIRIESLQAGIFKGKYFIREIQKVTDPQVRLPILRAAHREQWVTSGKNMSVLVGMIKAAEQGKDFHITEFEEPPTDQPINPGLWMAYQDHIRHGGTGTFGQWQAARQKVLAEQLQAKYAERPTPVAAPFKPKPEVKAEPKPEPVSRPILEAEILKAKADASACVDVKNYEKWQGWLEFSADTKFTFGLPDGRLLDSNAEEWTNPDPYAKSIATIIKVQAPPAELQNPVLTDVGGILKWTERAERKPYVPPKQGLELWEGSPMPEHVCYRHCKCEVISGKTTPDGLYFPPRKVED
jgi:hypothetical protein